MANANNLVETTVSLMRTYLKANMPAALADLRTERGDSAVTTEPPVDYFISEPNAAYRTPALFIIPDRINFRINQTGANHINAAVHMRVAVVVEDRDTARLSIKAWRYQAAMHSLLEQRSLTTVSEDVKIVIKVTDATFSAIYTPSQKAGDVQGTFRKEVLLECEVEQYENY